jgi:cobalt/nickel transport system permease protein
VGANHLHHHPPSRGPLHHWPAGVKLAGALAIILTAALMPEGDWIWLLGLAVVLGVLVMVSRLSIWFLLKRMLLLEPLVLGVAGLVLFQPNGIQSFAFVLLKTNLCLLTTLLFSNSTPPTEILRVLQRLHTPRLFLTTLTLMHRYLFLLAEESGRMQRARASRTFMPGRAGQWRSRASVIGQLFVRASARAERIYDSMCARGWK